MARGSHRGDEERVHNEDVEKEGEREREQHREPVVLLTPIDGIRLLPQSDLSTHAHALKITMLK